MKNVVISFIMILGCSSALFAQTGMFQKTQNNPFGISPLKLEKPQRDEASHLKILFSDKKKELDGKTIATLDDIKVVTGKDICLRPDYKYSGGLRFYKDYVTFGSGSKVTNEYYIKTTDILKVIKAKKSELTVMLGNDKIKIESHLFRLFMLSSERDDMAASIEGEIQKQKENTYRAQEEAEQTAKQSNLSAYYNSINNMAQLNEGPVVINTDRVYDATIPFWKKQYNKNEINTFRDEKFLINKKEYNRNLPKLRQRYSMDSKMKEQLDKLSFMQEDTFGLFSEREFINLRTGDVFLVYRDGFHKLFESVSYMENLKAPGIIYDGTESLEVFVGKSDRPYRERYINALIGEKVFLTNVLKYDVITDIEDDYELIFHFANHGPIKDYCFDKIVPVKWYEQLQKMVGKKVIRGGNIKYYKDYPLNTTWREDLLNEETHIIEKIEVKEGQLEIHLNGLSKPISATRECGMLTFPINIEEEWKIMQMGGDSRLENSPGYLSYEAVITTTPQKPAEAKKYEAEVQSWLKQNSKNFSDLRNHKFIGTKVEKFLKIWTYAKLINTTINGSVIIKVYNVHNYQLIFRNGICVSQTRLY